MTAPLSSARRARCRPGARPTPHRWGLPALLVFLSLSVLALPRIAAAAAGPEPNPTLVAFDFESCWDNGRFGQWVANNFTGHAKRRGKFTILDPLSFEELLRASGAKVNMQTPPADVAALAGEYFAADLAVWGKTERLAEDSYRIHVRIVDCRKDPPALVLDKAYSSTKHGVQISVDAALNELLGLLHGSQEPRPKALLSAVVE